MYPTAAPGRVSVSFYLLSKTIPLGLWGVKRCIAELLWRDVGEKQHGGTSTPMLIEYLYVIQCALKLQLLNLLQLPRGEYTAFVFISWLLYNYHNLYLNILLPRRWNNLSLKHVQIYALPFLLLSFLLFFLCYEENNGNGMHRHKLEPFILINWSHKGNNNPKMSTAHCRFVKWWFILQLGNLWKCELESSCCPQKQTANPFTQITFRYSWVPKKNAKDSQIVSFPWVDFYAEGLTISFGNGEAITSPFVQ